MRIPAKALILASVAAGVATLGPAGAAHASTVECAEGTMASRSLPGVLVVTCAEADGDLRRTLSTVVNNSDQTIALLSLRSLTSFPQYALTDCGASQLAPGAQAACVTGWVSARNATHDGVASFSLVQAVDAQGRGGTQAFNIHTRF
ncbi:MAG TPA: hypothetical protein VFT95_22585 [Micromonosporaceae bacterium]|nr:hypothetical protein [Micromonosporaceae bacterium]